jgi:hypothetical protein
VPRAKSWLDMHGTDLHRYGLLLPGPNIDRRVPVNGRARVRR